MQSRGSRKTRTAIVAFSLVMSLLFGTVFFLLLSFNDDFEYSFYRVTGYLGLWETPEKFWGNVGLAEKADPELVERFREISSKYEHYIPLDTIREYYDLVGPRAMLEVLEDENPLCHEKGHNIGMVVFEEVGNIYESLLICGDLCTSSCVHGIFYNIDPSDDGAVHVHEDGSEHVHPTPDSMEQSLMEACEDNTIYRSGTNKNTCYHGMGHGFTVYTRYDINASLDFCDQLKGRKHWEEATYHCANGAFMEYHSERNPDMDKLEGLSCDSFGRYEAPCYRYRLGGVFEDLSDMLDLVDYCLGKEDPESRLGCASSIGKAVVMKGAYTAGDIARYCDGRLDSEQSKVCVLGFLSRFNTVEGEHANINPERECSYLEGDLGSFCMKHTGFNVYDSGNFKAYQV